MMFTGLLELQNMFDGRIAGLIASKAWRFRGERCGWNIHRYNRLLKLDETSDEKGTIEFIQALADEMPPAPEWLTAEDKAPLMAAYNEHVFNSVQRYILAALNDSVYGTYIKRIIALNNDKKPWKWWGRETYVGIMHADRYDAVDIILNRITCGETTPDAEVDRFYWQMADWMWRKIMYANQFRAEKYRKLESDEQEPEPGLAKSVFSPGNAL